MKELLIVEDDEQFVKLLEMHLHKHIPDVRLHAVHDGEAALSAVHEKSPDIILLDLRMPKIDGLEFAEAIRKAPKTAHIPIVIISSHIDDVSKEKLEELDIYRSFNKLNYREEATLIIKDLIDYELY